MELSILLGLAAAAALHRAGSRRGSTWAPALALLCASGAAAVTLADPAVGLVTLAAVLALVLPLLAICTPLWPRRTWSAFSLAIGAVAASWLGAL